MNLTKMKIKIFGLLNTSVTRKCFDEKAQPNASEDYIVSIIL